MLWKIRLKNIITYLIYNIFLLTLAYFLNRFFQVLIFILFFNFIRNCFNYRFHAETIIQSPIKAIRFRVNCDESFATLNIINTGVAVTTQNVAFDVEYLD